VFLVDWTIIQKSSIHLITGLSVSNKRSLFIQLKLKEVLMNPILEVLNNKDLDFIMYVCVFTCFSISNRVNLLGFEFSFLMKVIEVAKAWKNWEENLIMRSGIGRRI